MKYFTVIMLSILTAACADLESTNITPGCNAAHPDYYVTVVYCNGELANVDVMCDPNGDIEREECVDGSEQLEFSRACDVVDKCWSYQMSKNLN